MVACNCFAGHLLPMHMLINDTITLRPFQPTDRHDLVAGLNDWAVARWLARVPYPYRLDHADEFLGHVWHRQVETAIATPELGAAWAVCDHDRVIGGMVVNPHDDNGRREIGFWLARPFWGRQIMRRGVGVMIDEILRLAPRTRLTACANHDNLRSQGLILGLGFVETGQREVMSTPLQRPVLLRCFHRP